MKLLRSVLLTIVCSCCTAGGHVLVSEPPGPWIRLNSEFLPNQSDVVLTAGSPFRFSCHGNGSVRWSSTALRLSWGELSDPVEVRKSDPRHTGTYRCGYANRSLEHAWVHLYVTDPAHPDSVFVTPRSTPSLKEGQDFLFRCLPTDPFITNLTLQSEDRGRGLPAGMNVTFDSRRGALIRDLQRSFKGRYVCSGWKDGRHLRSPPVDLLVVPRLSRPPSMSLSQDDFIRLEGEPFEVTCLSSNPSHFYNLTWTHPHLKNLNVTISRHYGNNRHYTNSTLRVLGVGRPHSGRYTCTAVNEGGVAMATAHLRVVDHPYLRSYLQLTQHANAKANTRTTEVSLFANISIELQETLDANVSSTADANITTMDMNMASGANISVEVYEGQDVTLTFVMEAYPPIRTQHWTTPAHINSDNNAVCTESHTVHGYRSEASLLLRRVRQEDQGRYLFHVSNAFFNGSQIIDLRIYRPPTATITLENDTLTCSSSGYPLPTILWFTCPGIQLTCANLSTYQVSQPAVTSREGEELRTHLPLSTDDDVTVECVAYNFMGESRDVFNVPLCTTGHHTVFTPPLIGALSAAAFLLLLLLVVFYRCRQKPRYEIRWKIIESTDGNSYTFVDPAHLPYNDHKWEFPRDKLRLGAVLGSGAFGKVVEATAYGLGTDSEVTRVAVKMLKPSAHSEERDALMSELKILSHLGYHDNIVNLLGACTRGGPMLMITEYCSHGDLLNFLRSHAQDFLASMLDVEEVEDEALYKNMAAQLVRLRSDSGISCCSDGTDQEMKPGPSHLGVQTDSLSVEDLMRFSYQVSQGLDFLSARNCIHRDVAARNVLLTDHRVAKICDFGLARDIRHDDSYIVQGNARLPVKWMAPESIFQCVYTVQSDVWSYAVLLWEIFSLGESPYPNVAVDTNFYKMIKDGRHMQRPDFAPDEMYQLMKLCWSLEPTHRPTFKVIGQLISRLLPSTNDMWPHQSEQPEYRNINECREEEEEVEEEVRGGTVKRGEEEERGPHDNDSDEEEEERNVRNIYQLS